MVRTVSGFGPMTRILAVLGMGMVAGAVLMAQPQAQDAGGAALAAQIAALTARIDALEAEKDKPLEVKAPFRVLTDSGKEIFSISEGGNAAPMMKLTGSGSSIELSAGDKAKIELNHGDQYAFLSAEGNGGALHLSGAGDSQLHIGPANGGMALLLDQGVNRVALKALPEGPLVQATTASKAVRFGMFSGVYGISAAAGDRPLASLTDRGDGRFALQISPPAGGDPVVQVGYHATGRSALSIWDGNNPLVRIEASDSASAGQVKVFSSGEEIATVGRIDDARNGLKVKKANDEAFIGSGATGLETTFLRGSEKMVSLNTTPDGADLTIGPTIQKQILLSVTAELGGTFVHPGRPPGSDGTGQGAQGLPCRA